MITNVYDYQKLEKEGHWIYWQSNFFLIFVPIDKTTNNFAIIWKKIFYIDMITLELSNNILEWESHYIEILFQSISIIQINFYHIFKHE